MARPARSVSLLLDQPYCGLIYNQEINAMKRLLRLDIVLDRTAQSRTNIYEMIKRGEFAKPVKIGRCSYWPEHEVNEWIEQKIAEGRS